MGGERFKQGLGGIVPVIKFLPVGAWNVIVGLVGLALGRGDTVSQNQTKKQVAALTESLKIPIAPFPLVTRW